MTYELENLILDEIAGWTKSILHHSALRFFKERKRKRKREGEREGKRERKREGESRKRRRKKKEKMKGEN